MPLRLPTPDPNAVYDAQIPDTRNTPITSWARPDVPRDFVSEHRVHQVLRARFGSRPTGERGPGYVYWQTAEGVRFPLEDPLAVPGSKSVFRADGTEKLFYSYGYVVSLLRRIDEAERGARARRDDQRAAALSRRESGSARTTSLR